MLALLTAAAETETTALDTAIAHAAAHADDYSLTAWAWSLPRPVVAVVDRELVIVDGIPYVTEIYYDHVDGAWGVRDLTAAAPALLDAQDTGALDGAAREVDRYGDRL